MASKRLAVWREILRGPWTWIVASPFALLAAFQSVRDEFLPRDWQEALKLLRWLPDWDWKTWALIALLLFFIGTLESSYRIIREARPTNGANWRDLLSRALVAGRQLLDEDLHQGAYADWANRVNAWINATADFLREQLGEADEQLFLTPPTPKMARFKGSINDTHNIARLNIDARLQALTDILKRPIHPRLI
jgi:hypothetical protein